MKGFNGFIGYGIRELNQNETNQYCSNKTIRLNFPIIQSQVKFTSDFMIRTYSSGCYYFDTNTGKWYSNGMDVLEDTNFNQTHCISNHLTSFAGGLMILPSTINIEYYFSGHSMEKSFLSNFVILIITCIYILFALFSRYMDIQDEKRMNLVLLKDNNQNDTYFYEVIVYTGSQKESGTKSKVI